jgi:large subunit ribosomal protein L22
VPGLKTNERPGTRAVLRHYRMSASKARQVLDLIRDKDVTLAAEILRSTPREAAGVVGKVLASAVANAMHNDGQDPEDLYVSACYADEGATMKRWRPRARGRASRIRKRTCHITVIVSRLPDERLARRRAEREASGAGRSRRVAESRRRADLSGRLSRRRTAQAERAAAAEVEAESEEEIEDALVEDAEMEQSAADIVEGAESDLDAEDEADEDDDEDTVAAEIEDEVEDDAAAEEENEEKDT